MKRIYGSGWYGERTRHYLAAKGVKTSYRARKGLPSGFLSSLGSSVDKSVSSGLKRHQTLEEERREDLLNPVILKEEQLKSVIRKDAAKEGLSPEEKERAKQIIERTSSGKLTEQTLWREWEPEDSQAAIVRLSNEDLAQRNRQERLQLSGKTNTVEFKDVVNRRQSVEMRINVEKEILRIAQGNPLKIPVPFRKYASQDVKTNPTNVGLRNELRAAGREEVI